jgi:hypothetical protein
MTGKDLFMLQRSPILQLRDAADNPVIGFRGTFEVRKTGGEDATQLGIGDKMAYFTGGTQIALPRIFFTSAIERDSNLYLLFRSSCCSLLSEVSDDVRSSNMSLSAASTGIRIAVMGHVNGSIVRAGEPFSIIATAVANDGGTAHGFHGNVALDAPLTTKGQSGLLTILQSGTLVARAQHGVAHFDDLVMRSMETIDAVVTGFPVGYFLPQLQSAAASFTSTVGKGTFISIVQQPGDTTGGIAFTSQPTLQVVDKAGNTAIPFISTTISAVLQRASGSVLSSSNGKLLGSLTVQCNALTGVCAYSNLKIDKTGRYFLTFTSSTASQVDGLQTNGVFSDVFEVGIGAIATVISVQTPKLSTGGIQFSIQPVSAVTDAGGNWVYSTTQQVSVALMSIFS